MTAHPALLFDFLKVHHELTHALFGKMAQKLEQEHNLQLKDLMITREIHQGTRYPSEIAEKLRIPRDMVSRSIERLLQANLLMRSIDPQDSRRTLLSINPEGETLRRQVQATIAESVGPSLSNISETELQTLIALMQKLLTPSPAKEIA